MKHYDLMRRMCVLEAFMVVAVMQPECWQRLPDMLTGPVNESAIGSGGGAGGAYRGSAAVLDLLGGLLARVPIEAPSPDEQEAILAVLFPELAPLLPSAMETLALVHAAATAGPDATCAPVLSNCHMLLTRDKVGPGGSYSDRDYSTISSMLSICACQLVGVIEPRCKTGAFWLPQILSAAAGAVSRARNSGGGGAARRRAGAGAWPPLLPAGPGQMVPPHAGAP